MPILIIASAGFLFFRRHSYRMNFFSHQRRRREGREEKKPKVSAAWIKTMGDRDSSKWWPFLAHNLLPFYEFLFRSGNSKAFCRVIQEEGRQSVLLRWGKIIKLCRGKSYRVFISGWSSMGQKLQQVVQAWDGRISRHLTKFTFPFFECSGSYISFCFYPLDYPDSITFTSSFTFNFAIIGGGRGTPSYSRFW